MEIRKLSEEAVMEYPPDTLPAVPAGRGDLRHRLGQR